MKGKMALVMAGILLIGLVALAGCGSKATTTPLPTTKPKTTPSTTPQTSTGNKISIVDFSFNPSTLTIKPGDTVTWTNTSAGTTHTVTGTRISLSSWAALGFTIFFDHPVSARCSANVP